MYMDKFRLRIFLKPYNAKIAKNISNNNPMNTMIQNTSKICKYNLINVTNILHKLVEALVASKLTFTLLA
jgi:hypothetical protein